MAIAFILHATERSVLESNAPTTAEIAAALRLVARGTFPAGDGRLRSRTTFNGNWVGPAPRVTRSAPVGMYVTQAAWVWALDDAQQATSQLTTPTAAQGFMNKLADDARFALRAGASHGTISGDHWTVNVSLFNEAINGSMAWWQTGEASRSAVFIDSPPTLLSRATPVDNATGPNNPLAQGAGGSPDDGAAAAERLTTIVKGAAVVAGAGAVTVGVVYVAGPLIAEWLRSRRDRRARTAP